MLVGLTASVTCDPPFWGQSGALRIASDVRGITDVFLANWQPLAGGPLRGWLGVSAQLFSKIGLPIGSRAAGPIAYAPRENLNRRRCPRASNSY